MTKRKDKTRTKDIGTIGCSPHLVVMTAEHGSYVDFLCPFCKSEIKSVRWSLQGTGKACECGALFKMFDEKVTAYRKEKQK